MMLQAGGLLSKHDRRLSRSQESHQAVLWLGGLEAITDGLRDSKDLALAGAKLVEASLFAAKPSSCLG